jgi:hypothetical protein
MRLLQHGGPADQGGPGQLLVDHDLRRPQHALLLALGIDDARFLAPVAPS